MVAEELLWQFTVWESSSELAVKVISARINHRCINALYFYNAFNLTIKNYEFNPCLHSSLKLLGHINECTQNSQVIVKCSKTDTLSKDHKKKAETYLSC